MMAHQQTGGSPMTTASCKRIVKWALDTLHPHRSQALLCSPPPPHEVKELADDIKVNGQLNPVEILPDGTVLSGHECIAAFRLLGWSHIDVWVRDDLAHDAVAAEKRMIMDNLDRREMGPFDIAKCYERLKVLARTQRATNSPALERRDLGDELSQRLGVSRRNLDRYSRIATQTPSEIQDAVAAGKLAVTSAERVARLTPEEREHVAAMIRRGGDARAVVRQCLATAAAPLRPKHDADHAVAALVRSLRSAVRDLDASLGNVTWVSALDFMTLGAGEKLIQRLCKRILDCSARVALAAEPLADAVGDDVGAIGTVRG
jgi:ParB family transcriptional regulator, chromosome partitioning protein